MNLLGSYANDYMIELKNQVDDEIMRILDAEVFFFFPPFLQVVLLLSLSLSLSLCWFDTSPVVDFFTPSF